MKLCYKALFLPLIATIALSGCEKDGTIVPISGTYLNAGVYLYDVSKQDCLLLELNRLDADLDNVTNADVYGTTERNAYRLFGDVNVEVMGESFVCWPGEEIWLDVLIAPPGGMPGSGGVKTRKDPFVKVRIKNPAQGRQVHTNKGSRKFDAGTTFYVDAASVKNAL